ncbi:MAG: 50S ribosomal protein L30 [Syntrophobacterales bacterium]|nr:MAG: 50S ribosomal protein L30 [Syntrophobacterales bacterium]
MDKSSNTLRVRLIKSGIGRPLKQRKVLKGLNLNRMNKIITLKDTREIRGMIEKVSHLVETIGE